MVNLIKRKMASKKKPTSKQMDLAREIGLRLKAARSKTTLTQDDVGKMLGLGRSGYTNIETGRVLINLEHLLKLPPILGESVTYFLGLNEMDDLSKENTVNAVDVYTEYRDAIKEVGEQFDESMRAFSVKLSQLSPESQREVFDLVDELFVEELEKAVHRLSPAERMRLMRQFKGGG